MDDMEPDAELPIIDPSKRMHAYDTGVGISAGIGGRRTRVKAFEYLGT